MFADQKEGEKEPKEWKEFIEIPDNPDEIKGIREKTRTGRPPGIQ